MKKIALLLAGLAIGQIAMAQVSVTGSTLTYTQDFNTLDTSGTGSTNLPTGWGIYEWGGTSAINSNYRAGTGSANTGDTYSFGAAASTERSLGSLGSAGIAKINYGVKFANNTGAAISSLNIAFKEEQWRVGDTTSTNLDSVRLYYAVNADITDTTFTNWTEIPAALMTSIITQSTSTSGNALNGNATFSVKTAIVPVNVPAGGNITLRWYDFNSLGSDDGLSVDSLTVTFTTTGSSSPRPLITALSPADNASNVAAGANLQITFDRNITANAAGNIRIKNVTDQTTTTKGATSGDVTISGKTVTVANAGIVAGKDYFVTFDSVAFDTAGYKSYGIYDTTAWNFSTVPAVVTVTSLNEGFDAACVTNALPAGWSKQNIVGPGQQWNCYTSTGGKVCMRINGYSGGNNANEDWLITPKVNLSGQNGALQFDVYKRFAGTELKALYSTSYTGYGDPNAASWTDLNIAMSPTDTGSWKTYTAGIATTQQFFVAFKYISTTSDGYDMRLDSVIVNAAGGVINTAKNNLDIVVVGNATSNNINLMFSLAHAGAYRLSVYDITGREVYNSRINGQSGKQYLSVNGLNLTNGMYIIKMGNEDSYGVTKAIIQ